MTGLAKAEPVSVVAAVTAALGVATILGLDPELAGALEVLIGAVLVVVRQVVTPVATAAATAATAASDAAVLVAAALQPETVGPEGEITENGLTVASLASSEAAHDALKKLGVPQKVRIDAVRKAAP